MKNLFLLLLITTITACSQQNSFTKEQQALLDTAKEAQHKLNVQYADKEKSPLTDEDFKTFRSLDFYPINLKYTIKATFVKNEFPVPFEMETTTDRKPIYQKYGTLHFTLDGVSCELPVYQNMAKDIPVEYKNHIFVPFTDLTTGKESYGGGRYVDLELPFDTTVIVDFNSAYNPYCAYNHKYSCAVPPKENDLKVAIKAGVMKFHD
ncbi:MAG TPA: DUF1684 domain-containing protein [Lutibacter sp.]|nr:DUF1684 domain-containing protein [Lutibacter sp.]